MEKKSKDSHCCDLRPPFVDYEWKKEVSYTGNYGPEGPIEFRTKGAPVLFQQHQDQEIWIYLLEGFAGEKNDAVLQRFAFVKRNTHDGAIAVYDPGGFVFENAGGGGPYDDILDKIIIGEEGELIGIREGGSQRLLKVDLSGHRVY